MAASEMSAPFPARLGLGTWKMGASKAARAREVGAVRYALDIGYRLIDTAEMYADGGAEQVIGEALRGYGPQHRAQLCIVSKVLPDNASHRGTVRACEASLRRLGCEYLDLYLLHWPGGHEFSETLRGFEQLRQRGLIRHFGVSNLDLPQLQRWLAAEQSLGLHTSVVCNQLYYCLEARAVEFEQLPWQRAHGIATMAYSPLGRGGLARHPLLQRLAAARGATAAQLALAWCMRAAEVVAIPKSVHAERIAENLGAVDLVLTDSELAQIDQAFPPPQSPAPLAMI